MQFSINNILYKNELLSKLIYNNDNTVMSKSAKIKIISFKVAFNDYIRDYSNFIYNLNKELMSERHWHLFENRLTISIQEQFELNQLDESISEARNKRIEEKINTIVDIPEITKDSFLTKEEYKSLLDVNVDRTVVVVDTMVDGAVFCEEIYKEFVYTE